MASAGTETSSRTVEGLSAVVRTPSTTKPPPKREAVHPVGVFLTARPTRSLVGVWIVRSKLTFEPGATATAGYGVVSVSASAAEALAGIPTRSARSIVTPNAAAMRCNRRPIPK